MSTYRQEVVRSQTWKAIKLILIKLFNPKKVDRILSPIRNLWSTLEVRNRTILVPKMTTSIKIFKHWLLISTTIRHVAPWAQDNHNSSLGMEVLDMLHLTKILFQNQIQEKGSASKMLWIKGGRLLA